MYEDIESKISLALIEYESKLTIAYDALAEANTSPEGMAETFYYLQEADRARMYFIKFVISLFSPDE